MKTRDHIQVPHAVLAQIPPLPPTATARNYLDLANSYTHQYAAEKDVCRHVAGGTYDAYLQLVRKDDRHDLEKSVRLAVGIKGGRRQMGHMWAEIRERNAWQSYETTINPTAAQNTDESRMNRTTLNLDIEADARTIPGSAIAYPLPESFFLPGGMAAMLLRAPPE